MYHQSSRRKELIRRTLVYVIMCLSIIALVVVLLFIVLGYRFNRSDGRIEQGGLLQFDTRPSGADVTIDGTTAGSRTASKATVGAGQHFITMNRSGYRQWQKSVNVAPGSVVWLNYARLIPNELKTETTANFPALAQSRASFDGKWIAVKENAASASISLVDISRETVRQSVLDIPTSAFTTPATGKPQVFSLEAWDPTNRYLLVKHTFNDTELEWLIVDTENVAQTVNLTRLVNVPISKVLFSGASSNTVFVRVGTDVRKVEISAGTLSRPLVSNVADFSLYDRSTIVYTTAIVPETGKRTAGYYEDGTEKPHVLKTYENDEKTPLRVALGKYFNEHYVALGHGESTEIYRGRLPTGDATVSVMTLETTITQPGGVEFLEIRNNGRFVVAQTGSDFQVYDNELKQVSKTTLKNASPTTGKLNWLDGYYTWSDLDGTLRLYEFDGTNQHDIMPVVPGQAVTLAQDGIFIYGFTTINGSYQLSRSRLQLP